MHNSAYVVEILRIGRITSTKTIFINHCSAPISRTINKEENVNTISKTLSKTFGKHIQNFSKFLQNQFVESIYTKNKQTFDSFRLERL